ncbi:hypothetical protein J6590_042844 [Homalodisca vitripennis]|nr:hypothetical protein J6590_042844 [Homalodisca vitripennis]
MTRWLSHYFQLNRVLSCVSLRHWAPRNSLISLPLGACSMGEFTPTSRRWHNNQLSHRGNRIRSQSASCSGDSQNR